MICAKELGDIFDVLCDSDVFIVIVILFETMLTCLKSHATQVSTQCAQTTTGNQTNVSV